MDQKASNEASSNGRTHGELSLLSKSAKGATFLIVLQIGSRALTFAVNQLLLRYLSPELLGISTQLEVYSISVLFFARESLRVAVQRQTDTTGDEDEEARRPVEIRGIAARKTQEVINLTYISISLGVFFAVILAWAYLESFRSNITVFETPFFKQALQLYGLAAFVELLAEPCFIVVQQKSEYKIRAAVESTATVLRCLVASGLVVLAARKGLNVGVLPFAVGQLVYGSSLLFGYYRNVRAIAIAGGFSLMPRPIISRYHTAGTAS